MTGPSAPPLLLGAALLWWGWQGGHPALALGLALLVEAAPRSPWRWHAEPRDFHRLADVTNLLFVAAALVLFAQHGARGVFALAGWLPLVLVPLVLGQRLSLGRRMPLGALFLSLRGRPGAPGAPEDAGVDVGFAYLAVVLVAALVEGGGPWLYPGTAALAAWALWAVRPRRTRALPWALLVLGAAGAGLAGFTGLQAGQSAVEARILAWFEQRLWQRSDPYRAETAIGQLGRLKLSDRILFHVHGHDPAGGPLLLRQASFRSYRHGTWHAPREGFSPVDRDGAADRWRLAPGAAPREVRLGIVLRRGRGLLPLPGDTTTLAGLPAEALVVNPWGAVVARKAPGFASVRVAHGGGASRDAPPGAQDLAVPEPQRELLAGLVAELGLAGRDPAEAEARLRAFFDEGFRYSLRSEAAFGGGTALARFLTRSRAGHCEYFATATVLLLRAAGLPARYATGYSVQEYLPLGAHVVRRRHAHSWALVWTGTRWRDVDLTPAVWVEADAAGAPWWQPLYDAASWVSFGFQRWRWAEREGLEAEDLLWLLPPLLGLLIWRLARRPLVLRRAREAAPAGPEAEGGVFAGAYACLAARLGPRAPGETLRAWWRRVAPGDGSDVPSAAVRELLDLRYRERFAPRGLSPAERERLARLAGEVERRLGRRRGRLRTSPGCSPGDRARRAGPGPRPPASR